jgi:hypothetical protein
MCPFIICADIPAYGSREGEHCLEERGWANVDTLLAEVVILIYAKVIALCQAKHIIQEPVTL